jgi:putative SOS response-associated peptidase YedK
MWFEVVDQPLFAVAGFWQATAAGNGFTMVTCDPNELVAPIHPKAMITILEPTDWDTWLRGSYDDVVALQRPYPGDRMTVRGPEFPTRQPASKPL